MKSRIYQEEVWASNITFPKGDKMSGMSGCYSGGITAMSTNGPISVSMQALKILQISLGLPNKITNSLNISEVWWTILNV